MKKTLALMLFAVLFMNPVFAENSDKHHGMKQEGMMGHGQGSGMGMMGNEKMQEHMTEMREKMSRIRSEDDPEKRRELMREHMESMQGAMQGMRHMGPMAEGSGDMGSEMPMEQRMKRMEQHMQMMQGMMEQMMNRDAVAGESDR